MIHNKKLEKELKTAVIVTVLLTLLFCVLCAVCLLITDNLSTALRICLILSIPFAALVCTACCRQHLKTVFKIQINETDIIFKSLLREITVSKPHSVAIEINFGKITLHSDDEGATGSLICTASDITGGVKEITEHKQYHLS